jgi:glutaredoxin
MNKKIIATSVIFVLCLAFFNCKKHQTNNYKITVCGVKWCHACGMAKQYFESHRLKYTYFDLDENPAADKFINSFAKKNNIKDIYLPFIVINKKYIMGFDAGKIEEALNCSSK